MQPINKLGLLLLAVLIAIYWAVINYESLRFDNKVNVSTRLSAAAAVEPLANCSDKALRSTGERCGKGYSQPPVDNYTSPVDNSKRLVHSRASARGYNSKQLKCLFELIERESRWNHKANNPSSTAYGLFQQLKLDPKASKQKQIRLGLTYVEHRYGTACKALKHHDLKGWY